MEKQEVLDLFRERVHPRAEKRAKLSVHLKPQAPRVNNEAIEAGVHAVQEARLIRNIAEEFLGADPIVTDCVNPWREVSTEDSDADDRDSIEEIPAVIEEYPVSDEGVDGLPVGVTRIGELKDFKATLQVSNPPKPLVQWNDLPTPNP